MSKAKSAPRNLSSAKQSDLRWAQSYVLMNLINFSDAMLSSLLLLLFSFSFSRGNTSRWFQGWMSCQDLVRRRLLIFSTGVKSIPICGAGGVPHVDCVPHKELNDTVIISYSYSINQTKLLSWLWRRYFRCPFTKSWWPYYHPVKDAPGTKAVCQQLRFFILPAMDNDNILGHCLGDQLIGGFQA